MIVDEGPDGQRLLSYCTNVHPGESVDEILSALRRHAVPLRHRFGSDEPFALGLRLGAAAVRELEDDEAAFDRFESFLALEDFISYTVNAFPYGEFHADALKDRVYLPDWTQDERYDYTLATARLLARLLPAGYSFGTISTLPLGFRRHGADRTAACARRLVRLAGELAVLEGSTGCRIQVCLEPEPACLLEKTGELVAFFRDEILALAPSLEAVDGRTGTEIIQRHLGACFDTCHAAVVFDEPSYSLEWLAREGIEVGKIQVSSALELRRPHENPEGLTRLGEHAEGRFLHQVVGRDTQGVLRAWEDLPLFLEALEHEDLRLDVVRCHFHVPIHLPDAYPLGTTQACLLETLNREQATRKTRHFEVETYTLGIIPGQRRGPTDLVDDLEQELRFARDHLAC